MIIRILSQKIALPLTNQGVIFPELDDILHHKACGIHETSDPVENRFINDDFSFKYLISQIQYNTIQ